MAVKDAIKAAAARFGAAIGGCFEYLWAPLILAYLAAFASFIVAFGDYFTWPKDKQTAFGRGFLGVTLALVMAHAVGTTALIVKTNRNWDDMEAHMAKWWVNATLQCFLFAHGCLLNYVVYYSRATVWTLVVVSIYAFAISQAAKFPPATWTALHSGSATLIYTWGPPFAGGSVKDPILVSLVIAVLCYTRSFLDRYQPAPPPNHAARDRE